MHIFLKPAVQKRPVLLLTDGHNSHNTIDITNACCDAFFCLISHTTHAL